MISRRGILKTLAGALVGAFGFAGYAFSIEPGHRLVTTRYRIRPEGWPDAMKLRIAVISDLHASEPQMGMKRIEEVVRHTNALKPDLILLLGDYGVGQTIYARAVPTADVARALSGLSAPLGRFGILGNHDYWGTSLRGWPYTEKKVNETAQKYRDMLATAGIRLMENDTVRLTHDGQPFWLIGTGSMIALPIKARKFRSFADLPGQLARITDDAPAILMAHEPDLFPTVPKRIGLTLSGHTHGGQVRLFGYSPITPSEFGNRYAYGHIVEDGRNLVVSGGLGTSAFPVRFGVPPEIVLIDLG
ncbi:MAG: metallophosphoesterase [Proteobacteria bacterium]|nr:metallophosphoesterase [Pseudomonadota bacterium]